MFVGIEERKSEYDTVVKELKLLLRSKIEVQEQQMNIAEGDVFKDIKDVRVVGESSQQPKGECAKLDRDIDELWRVMQRHSKRMCSMMKKEMNCFNSLTKEEVLG